MYTHEGPPLGAEDDAFHEHSDHWWETETAWFSFNVPERRLGGWLYTQVLAVQGLCNGGAWVWDDTPAGARYEVNRRGLAMPEGLDLRDVTLPNGNSIRVQEPLMRYELRYSDAGKFEAELAFEGIMPAHSHPLGVAPFWKGRHFDQPGHVHGRIALDGEEIAVDCLAGRDRSWGPRPLGPDPRKPKAPTDAGPARTPRAETGIGYVLASASPSESFLAYTVPTDDGSDDLSAGFLLRDGQYAPLASGQRAVEFDPVTRWIRAVHLEARDDLGRDLVAEGELVARHGEEGPSGTGLFRWRWGDQVGWGEDQSYCSEHVWRAVGAPPPG
jgi:hypothetical protein